MQPYVLGAGREKPVGLQVAESSGGFASVYPNLQLKKAFRFRRPPPASRIIKLFRNWDQSSL